MSLHTAIKDQIKEAMIAKDAVRLSVLRGLSAAFTNDLISKKKKSDELLADEEVLDIIRRQVKQRKDSIEQFKKGGRTDLADSESAELIILEAYLPVQMTKEEVLAYVQNKKSETGPIDPTKKNQFMGSIMKDLKGKADGMVVKEVIDSLFA